MGQSHSSDGGNPQTGDQGNVDDYYDLLGVERQASDEEIKKAYRRKALELHPDRNYGSVEQATKLFAEIQSAYEVLSDPQERAWYDSHRDVFLRGSQPGQASQDEFFYNTRMTTADEVLKTTVKYTGGIKYSDASTGFYGGLRQLFGQLAKEEGIACRWDNVDPVEYPDFGVKDDDYNEVVRPFYAAWNSFATRKSYSWKDRYRLSEAPDRRVRRLLEKQNKGLRDEAIQEFNDAVRSLVAFVRKRDPRYQDNQKSEDDRQRILRDTAAAQSARSRAARQAQLDELERQRVFAGWADSPAPEEELESISSEEEAEKHEIECVACNKKFKSDAQYRAHEKSKKHLKHLKQLRREMREQDGVIGQATVEEPVSAAYNQESEVIDKISLLEKNNLDHGSVEVGNREMRLRQSMDDLAPSSQSSTEVPVDQVDDDYAPRSEIEGRLGNDDPGAMADELHAGSPGNTQSTASTEVSSPLQLGKAKQKRAKKAAQKKAGTESANIADFKCVVCQESFLSKSKLFTHIREQDHAAPLSVAATMSAKSNKGRKK